MNIILLGAPGSGKGTQGALLADRLGVPKVATGDLLRAAVKDGTPLGKQAQSYMDEGLLVPDEVILGLIEEVVESDAARDGIIMDGFPRTPGQAESVERLIERRNGSIDHVLVIEVPDDELVKRLGGRAAEQGRSDDTPEAVRKRLQVFLEQTAPLIDYFARQGLVSTIDGVGTIETISERIREVLGR